MPRLTIRLLVLYLALLPASGALAQTMPGVVDLPSPVAQNGEAASEGGWDALARLLNVLKPGVDTTLAPTPSEITDRIEALLDAGRHQQALTLIQAQIKANKSRHAPGIDVQLAFLHARALAALGDAAGAERIYHELTTNYPELPEPWNNLAALYMQRGQLDRAQQALQTAILIDPKYGVAYANLADVRLMLARQTYEIAAKLGVPGAQGRARSVSKFLEQP